MHKGLKLLLVDDEIDLREILKDEFEYEGFLVTEAGTGKQAYETLSTQKFDIVVSDIRMPELSGVELLELLRDNNSTLPPVILITGYADITNDEAYDKGAYAIFAKPFNINEIIECAIQAVTPEPERLKKREPRLPIHQSIDLRLPSLEKLKDAKLINVGNGGVFVASKGPLPNPGDIVSFKFEFESDATTIEGTGQIRWVRESAENDLPQGFGIQFREVSAESLNIVIEHLKKNPTKSFIPRT